jgi:hypothetical protein
VLPDEASEPVAAAWGRPGDGTGAGVTSERQGSQLTLSSADDRWARFDLDTGELIELGHGERRLPVAGGTRRADGRRPALEEIEIAPGTRQVVVRARYRGVLEEATWAFHDQGHLRLEWAVRADRADADYLGIRFDGLEGRVRALTWLGLGPYRVWRNRLAGGVLGLWRTGWNDSVTGVDWRYPELPGFYAGVRWANLATDEGALTLAPDPGLFLGVFSPRFPDGARTAVAEVPEGITVLHRISAIGTKFHPPAALGPSARRPPPAGSLRGGVWLSFEGGGRARR